MNLKEFKKKLGVLKRENENSGINLQCHNLKNCERMKNCVFCEDSENCYKCTYCVSCKSSSHLNSCKFCVSCHHISQSYDCTACTDSAYLLMCEDCSECNYLLGCVGLTRTDFHILNERYSKSDYFKIVNKLKKEMRIK